MILTENQEQKTMIQIYQKDCLHLLKSQITTQAAFTQGMDSFI